MVYCDNCGSPVVGNFCQNCGYNLIQVPPQPYGPPAPSGRGAGKAVGAMILAIILVIILIATTTLVWWTFSVKMDVNSGGFSASMEVNADMKLDESSVDMKMEGGPIFSQSNCFYSNVETMPALNSLNESFPRGLFLIWWQEYIKGSSNDFF